MRVKAIKNSAEVHGAALKSKLIDFKEKDVKCIASEIEKLQVIENEYNERTILLRQELESQTHASIAAFISQSENDIGSLQPVSITIPKERKLFSRAQVDDEAIRIMIGTFIENEQENSPPIEPNSSDEKERRMQQVSTPFNNDLKRVREVAVGGLFSYNVSSICVSPDGCIWLGTCQGKVFLIDITICAAPKKLHVIETRDNSKYVCGGIACLTSGDAVVAYGGIPYVDKFTLDGKMVDFAKIPGTSGILDGSIAVSGNEVFVFTFSELIILSEHGQILKTFKPNSIVNLATCNCTMRLDGHITIYSKGILTTIDRDGKELSKQTNVGEDIANLQCDRYGNILASNNEDSLYGILPIPNVSGKHIFRIKHKQFCIDNEDRVLILTNKGNISIFEYLKQ